MRVIVQWALTFISLAKSAVLANKGHPLDDPISEECRNLIFVKIIEMIHSWLIKKGSTYLFGRKIGAIVASLDQDLTKDVAILVVSLVELVLAIV